MDCSTPGSPVLHYLPVCSDSSSLSWWCYLTISSSAGLFSFCLQSFPASGSFPMSWHFTSGGQSIRTSASASVLPMHIQGWFPLGLTCLTPAVQETLRSLLQHNSNASKFFGTQSSLWSNSHIHTWLLENSQLWLYEPLLVKWCLCFLICCLGLS